jgi:hypothetical protein
MDGREVGAGDASAGAAVESVLSPEGLHMSVHLKPAAFVIAVLLVLTFYTAVEPPWFRYALFAAWIVSTAAIVRASTAQRSPALQVTAALVGIGFVAFVVIAQSSETGSDVLLSLAAALGVGLMASFVAKPLLRA